MKKKILSMLILTAMLTSMIVCFAVTASAGGTPTLRAVVRNNDGVVALNEDVLIDYYIDNVDTVTWFWGEDSQYNEIKCGTGVSSLGVMIKFDTTYFSYRASSTVTSRLSGAIINSTQNTNGEYNLGWSVTEADAFITDLTTPVFTLCLRAKSALVASQAVAFNFVGGAFSEVGIADITEANPSGTWSTYSTVNSTLLYGDATIDVAGSVVGKPVITSSINKGAIPNTLFVDVAIDPNGSALVGDGSEVSVTDGTKTRNFLAKWSAAYGVTDLKGACNFSVGVKNVPANSYTATVTATNGEGKTLVDATGSAVVQ